MEGVQFPAQNIPAKQFEHHIVCPKKENRMPKRILPQEKPEEWLKRHYSSHIYHFFVFLSSSSISSLLSSLLLSSALSRGLLGIQPWFLLTWIVGITDLHLPIRCPGEDSRDESLSSQLSTAFTFLDKVH